ncbi:MAG: hypothetical protein K1Y02_24295, partial [Candidatus Hydrogenedentes bacterium]|nr:hypothetical protein [Candidatus Hydrogenedentota bacterium]
VPPPRPPTGRLRYLSVHVSAKKYADTITLQPAPSRRGGWTVTLEDPGAPQISRVIQLRSLGHASDDALGDEGPSP